MTPAVIDRLTRPLEPPRSSRPDVTVPVPQRFYIDIGNICNLHCPYCPTGNGATPAKDSGLMSREAFDRILAKIGPHARFVCLFNWGEPFVNKSLLHMVSTLSARGIRSHIDSNLTVRDFSEREADDIVRSGLSSLFASIDGATQASYEKYRVGGRLDRALGNLRRLVAARTRLGSDTPGLVWCFYLNRHNEHEIGAARRMAKEIGVDIWFKILSCPKEFRTRYIHRRRLLAPPKSVAHLHPAPVNEGFPRFDLHVTLPAVCRQPFAAGVINWNGDVYPCCAVSGAQFRLGNILDQELDEVWNGAPMQSCRRFLADYGPAQNGNSVCETVCTVVPSQAQPGWRWRQIRGRAAFIVMTTFPQAAEMLLRVRDRTRKARAATR